MTAPIVGQMTRETYAELGIELRDLVIDGDDEITPIIRDAFDVRGQLWKRVPHSLLADVLTAGQRARIAAIRNTLGTHSGRVDVCGPRIAVRRSYGWIRGGVLVWRSVTTISGRSVR